MKTLLVGDRPSAKNTNPDVPFVGTQSHKRIMRILSLAGIVDAVLANAYDSAGLEKVLPTANKYVALGAKAEARLSKLKIPHLKLPHPSGRNRYWNIKGTEEQCAERLKNYVSSR